MPKQRKQSTARKSPSRPSGKVASARKPKPKPGSKSKPAKERPPAIAPSRTPSGPAAEPPELQSLRGKIDIVDRRLVELLNERARHVVNVGKVKRKMGYPVYAPHREAQVLSKVLELNRGPLEPRTIEGVYRELMSGSFRLELPIRIGYLGPAGSYSHVGAVKHFGTSVDFEDLHTIGGVFTEVARGHVDFGLVPIENSIGGGIVETLQAFQEFHRDVTVYTEVQIEVHHALLANCAPSRVTEIHSKPEVFQQCRMWLATQYPKAELVGEASSSRGVKLAAEAPLPPETHGLQSPSSAGKATTPGIAAIGSTLAAQIYGVRILFENIEDNPNNITRFFVITSRKRPAPKSAGKGNDKTSIMFATMNEPGALVSVLSVFQRAGINLTHIDKRPSGRENWQYSFFIDAEGHIDDPWFASAIAQARGICRELHVLGSYPRSKRIL